jgi:hypothetical protein
MHYEFTVLTLDVNGVPNGFADRTVITNASSFVDAVNTFARMSQPGALDTEGFVA